MSTWRVYKIAGNRLTIDIGSVLDNPVEVVVSSDDYELPMGGGVAAAIRAAGQLPGATQSLIGTIAGFCGAWVMVRLHG